MSFPFNQKEIDEATKKEGILGRIIKTYKYPVTPKEAYKALYSGEPIWQIMGADEILLFTPPVIPDNVARGMVIDGSGYPMPQDHEINVDMFGIEWEYIASAYGSMVRPGMPTLTDANDWKKLSRSLI